jgi:hypothetical protein
MRGTVQGSLLRADASDASFHLNGWCCLTDPGARTDGLTDHAYRFADPFSTRRSRWHCNHLDARTVSLAAFQDGASQRRPLPVVAIVLSVLVLDGSIMALMLVGITLVLAGVALTRSHRKQPADTGRPPRHS